MKISSCNINLICYLLMAVVFVKGDIDEEHWVDPNIWLDSDTWLDDKTMQSADVSEDEVSPTMEVCYNDLFRSNAEDKDHQFFVLIYKKFVAALFNKQKFEKDQIDGNYLRIIEFNLKDSQFEMVKNLEDPHDLDGILNEILRSSITYSKLKWMQIMEDYSFWTILKSKYMQFVEFFSFIDMKLTIIVSVVALGARYFQKRHVIKIIWVVVITIFIDGVYNTYQTCQQEQEVDNLIKVTKDLEESLQSSSRQITTSEELVKALKQSQPIISTRCRLDYVLMMYFTDLFSKFVKFLLDGYLKLVKESKKEHGFLVSGYYAVGAATAMSVIFKTGLANAFNIRTWLEGLSFFWRSSMPETNPRIIRIEPEVENGDRLSGENLSTLFNVLAQSTSPHSGVENLTNTSEGHQPMVTPAKENKSNESAESTKPQSFEAPIDQEKPCHSKAIKSEN